uniref:Neurotransmitter-gated ion-channel ligand-binding domain-containing protein n=1 Tax=Strigamia maritima TaxID=126957 RepID=T1JLQ0_STRMM
MKTVVPEFLFGFVFALLLLAPNDNSADATIQSRNISWRDLNISAILDSVLRNYDKRIRPNYGVSIISSNLILANLNRAEERRLTGVGNRAMSYIGKAERNNEFICSTIAWVAKSWELREMQMMEGLPSGYAGDTLGANRANRGILQFLIRVFPVKIAFCQAILKVHADSTFMIAIPNRSQSRAVF